MNYEQWQQLFGRAADDTGVAAAISQAGISKVLTIGADELSVAADIPGQGLTIVFTDESILRPGVGLVGRPVLTSVTMILKHPSSPLYRGPLPHGLTPDTTRDAMRQRFGAPIEIGEGRPWEVFRVEGLDLAPTYSRDLQSIARLTLRVPGGR
ncbi:MAG: hypothetical protein U1E90_15745 [Burkholderiaceae bacterium]